MIKNSQPNDCIALVKAIVLSKAGGMENKTTSYDVNNKSTVDEIIDNHINLYDILKMSSKYDRISYELINKLPVVSGLGCPTYIELAEDYPRNDVTLETYLTILAFTPDTLISRKYGENVALTVSKKARKIIEETEITSNKRLEALKDFDKYLRNNNFNPGTTADFTAASIFLGLLEKHSGETVKDIITY
jgi:triphosphoribosyl-dephospho-CoA synthase